MIIVNLLTDIVLYHVSLLYQYKQLREAVDAMVVQFVQVVAPALLVLMAIRKEGAASTISNVPPVIVTQIIIWLMVLPLAPSAALPPKLMNSSFYYSSK